MRLSDFDYDLPQDLIAQEPPPERDGARMLVLHRDTGTWEDRTFRDLPEFLRPGDCLALNDSRVLPSRLFANSGRIEVMLIEPLTADAREWRALVRPGRKMPFGMVVRFDDHFSAEVAGRGERGERTLRFTGEDVYDALDRLGHMPLPPYIKREDQGNDRERYQTVFARERGSVAAPTAGLHFTSDVLNRIPRESHTSPFMSGSEPFSPSIAKTSKTIRCTSSVIPSPRNPGVKLKRRNGLLPWEPPAFAPLNRRRG